MGKLCGAIVNGMWYHGPMVIGQRFEVGDQKDNLIGRGGMGDVYLGRDLETGDNVAVKALKPDLIDPSNEIITRFVREGQALGQLNHPNIVAVIDTVKETKPSSDSPVYYLVMEYVKGGSLQTLLSEQKQLPVRQVLEISLDLADALTRAHRLGIIHRDLKPANVLLSEDGTPRLTDFGLAHMADHSSLTQAGTLIGTIDYLSPEACTGQVQDERSDIWSFGVLLWEMLTGQTPFRRDSVGATIGAILSAPTPALGHYCPEAPESLAHLVELMLAKDPGQRLPSMRLVGAELETILQGRDSTLSAVWGHPAGRPGLKRDMMSGGDPEKVDTWSARQALMLMIASHEERGDLFMGQTSLAFAYSVREEIELDNAGAAIILRSALVHNEPPEPWIASFDSDESAAESLRDFYETYPRSDVRGRIVKALTGLAGTEVDQTLLSIVANDDSVEVRTEAALEAGRRGYQEQVMGQTLDRVRKDNNPADLVTLSALVDQHRLPEDSDLYLKLQVSMVLARRRWRRYRAAVFYQARYLALHGILMALYGATTPLQMARTAPESYQGNAEAIGVPAWIFALMVFFAL